MRIGRIHINIRELGLSAVVVTASVLRLFFLAQKSLWFDEGYSVEAARLPWKQLALLLWHREGNMALYYVLLHAWLYLGSSEFFVRSLSVVFAVATIPLLYLLGRDLFSARAGWIAAALMAVNAYHVRYAQEARAYSLVVFLACLSSWLLVRSVKSDTKRTWTTYAITCALMIYSHIFGLLVVAAQWASLLWLRPRGDSLLGFRRAAVWFAFLALPLAAWLFVAGTAPVRWVPASDARSLLDTLLVFSGNGGYPLLAVYLGGCALALQAAWKSRRASRDLRSWPHVFIWAWFLVPIAIVLAVSVVRPIFVARYLIICLPALVLLVAEGIASCRPVLARYALLAAAIILSLHGVQSYYLRDFDLWRDDWRSASQFLLSHTENGDGIYFYTSPGRMAYDYYRSQAPPGGIQPMVLSPAHARELDYRDFLPSPIAEELRDLPSEPPRLWLFLNQFESPAGPDRAVLLLRNWFRRDYDEVLDERFPGLELVLFAMKPGANRPEGPVASETSKPSHP